MNDAALSRISRYIDSLDLPEQETKQLLSKTKDHLESAGKSADDRDVLRTALKFARSLANTDSTPSSACLPPIARSPMAFRKFSKSERSEELRRIREAFKDDPALLSWKRSAAARRLVLVFFLLVSIATGFFATSTILYDTGISDLELAIVGIFTLLFAWIAVNFFTVLFGIFTFVYRRDRFNPSRALQHQDASITAATRVAIVMPIYNENVAMVFSAMRAVYESLQALPEAEHFNFFILSDTSDPDIWIDEETAWRRMCREFNACGKAGRIIYRHRKSRIGRKSGNIADFCRRWGKKYTYMIVLDSDSLMDGSLIANLTRIMDRRPDIGILQTVPKSFNAKTPLARLQQFSGHAYGPVFFRGLHFWQLGDATFWGHNAIIRLYPFMKYCALPKIGSMILSHDFVEAALMRRAGWGVWLAYDLQGSFEQPPSTLTAELDRDRRWCRGNIQHLRLLGLKGLSWGHRWLFLSGNMFYGASFLWMLLLVFTTADSVIRAVSGRNYFPNGRVLFPDWPAQHLGLSILLLVVTVVFLFTSKIFAVFIIALRKKQRDQFGGPLKLIGSFLAEMVFSLLLAPLRMLSHSYYFILAFLRKKVDWTMSPRFSEGISLADSIRLGGFGTVLASSWAFYLYHFDVTLFWWVSIVLIPLIFSVPISRWVSSLKSSKSWLIKTLLLVPSEVAPSQVIRRYETYLKSYSSAGKGLTDGFISAVVDPRAHLFHLEIRGKRRKINDSIRTRRAAIAEKALRSGPSALAAGEKKELLYDPDSLTRLHEEVWVLPAKEFAKWSDPLKTPEGPDKR